MVKTFKPPILALRLLLLAHSSPTRLLALSPRIGRALQVPRRTAPRHVLHARNRPGRSRRAQRHAPPPGRAARTALHQRTGTPGVGAEEDAAVVLDRGGCGGGWAVDIVREGGEEGGDCAADVCAVCLPPNTRT